MALKTLDIIGQEINGKLGELHLERICRQRKVYETVVDDDGAIVEVDTGLTESAATEKDIMLMEVWLKRNEIKAEIKQQSQLGKLRKMLNNKKVMPRIEHDEDY